MTVPSAVLAVFGFIGVIHWAWTIVGLAIIFGISMSGAILKILMMLGKVQVVYKASDMESRLLRFAYKLGSESLFEYDRRGVILEDDDA